MRQYIVLLAVLLLGCAQQQSAQQNTWKPVTVTQQQAPESKPPSATFTPDTTPPISDAPVTSSKWPSAFKRRSYQLGITISQFKTIRHPDANVWPNPFPVFSNEARATNNTRLHDAMIYGDWAKAGVIKCHYFYNDKYTAGYSGVGLMLGDIGSVTNFYFLPENEGKEPVLFFIESGGPTEEFGQTVKLYRQAMGEPTRIYSEPVQNKLGATFTNEIIIYQNDVSMIRISRFGDTLRVLKVEYILLPVMEQLSQRLGSLDQEKSRNL